MARTPKGRALGAALRREREQRGLTTRDLAELVGRNHGEVSRWETGERTAKPEHVAQLLTAMQIKGEHYNDIMLLAYDTEAPMWVATTLPGQRQQLAALVDAEQAAAEITEVAPLLIPGVLQTTDYIRAIMSGGGWMKPDEIVMRVAIRVGRREVITRSDPARYLAFIGEAALHQVIGDRSILAAQLRYLLDLAKRPNVTIRVIPFESGWQPALEGLFSIIQPRNSFPIVHVELRRTGLFVHEEEDVSAYEDAVEMVNEVALSPAESARLVKETVERMESLV